MTMLCLIYKQPSKLNQKTSLVTLRPLPLPQTTKWHEQWKTTGTTNQDINILQSWIQRQQQHRQERVMITVDDGRAKLAQRQGFSEV